jgi:processive 1,2-diacylglycerol beta-glucosyltransferase
MCRRRGSVILNILFITSNNTGAGHRSITEAVSTQIKNLSPDINISIIDGFAEGNIFAKASGCVYNTLAVYFPPIWDFIYTYCDYTKAFVNWFIKLCTKKSIMNAIEGSNPDLILSIHGSFVGSVIDMMKERNYKIPLMPIIADLDNVTSLWADNRVKAIICPTHESKQKMEADGMAPEKLFILGFPVRQQFTASVVPEASAAPKGLHYESDKPLALIISGSQGSRRSAKIIHKLLKADCCKLCVITGDNKRLLKSLEAKYKSELGKRLNVLGFTKELDKYMRAANFLITRASPNVLMEAVSLGKPIITTDAFYGQEKKNPAFVKNHKLGVYCKDLNKLPDVINQLTADGSAGLKKITANQRAYYKPDSTVRLAEFVLKCAKKE